MYRSRAGGWVLIDAHVATETFTLTPLSYTIEHTNPIKGDSSGKLGETSILDNHP